MAKRVFVADDHPIVRKGVIEVLREDGRFDVVGEADDGLRLLNDPRLETADVLVLDLSLPRMSGTEVLRRLSATRPSLPIVVLTSHPEDQFAARALADGAAFFVSKDRAPHVLLDAVARAAAGQRTSGGRPQSSQRSDSGRRELSRREHQVFLLLVSGRSVGDVAAELNLHSSTVSNHVANIREKLGLATVADMVRHAYATGMVAPPPDAGFRPKDGP